MTTSALAEYAAQMPKDENKEVNLRYPMYTVPLETVLRMSKEDIRPHQDLLRDGVLTEFDESVGKAMFVSHQWTSNQHPDPSGQQLKVFQEAMVNLLQGHAKVSVDAATEAVSGRAVSSFSETSLSASPIFVWYDYFCVPQVPRMSNSLSWNPFPEQRDAIASIPAYIHRCEFFVVLCPVLKHADTLATLGFYSWDKRGWCCTEKMVAQLAGRSRGRIVLIESPKHMSLVGLHDALYRSAGHGDFTLEEDRKYIVTILKNMLEKKLGTLLRQGNLPAYRFFLNHQHALFRDCDTMLLPGLLRVDPQSEEETSEKTTGLECFLYQNGFLNIFDVDDAGWSPFCYAVMSGKSSVVETLLSKAADPNFMIKKKTGFANLPARTSVLSLCLRFGDEKSLKLLLQARSDPNHRDALGATALFLVSFTDNVQQLRLLLAAGADPYAKNVWNLNPMQFACNVGATKVAMELVKIPGLKASPNLMSMAVMFPRGGAPEHISALLEAQCEVNQPYVPSTFGSKLRWSLFTAKYHLHGPSTMTTIAYHHHKATALMFSILAGRFAAAELLLEAGARVDLRNSRGQTAFDFAVLKSAPETLIQELWRRGAGDHARPAHIKWYKQHVQDVRGGHAQTVADVKDFYSKMVPEERPQNFEDDAFEDIIVTESL